MTRFDKCRECGAQDARSHFPISRLDYDETQEVLRITTTDGEVLEYGWRGNGYRWVHRGHTSAESLGKYMETAPGYFHAIEDMARELFRLRRGVLEEAGAWRRDAEVELERQRAAAMGAVEQFGEHLRRGYSVGRHDALARWRAESDPSATPPTCLSGVRGLRQMKSDDFPCFVYFLLKNEEVVYVGQTSKPWPLRILDHIEAGQKDFDDVWFTPVDRQSINAVERAYIRQFRPKHNVQGNRT
jgi:hypothetical protein